MSEDCCFEIISDNGKQRMGAKCMSCCQENKDNKFFWQGSKKGYGKYEVVCEICNKVIHNPDKQVLCL